MSKVNLPDIGSLANNASARQAINDNFAAIEEAFENTVSRDGTLPNQMEADLDLNGNDLLNVRRIDASEYYQNGITWEQRVTYGEVNADLFNGDGVQVSFPLSENPGSIGNLDVSIGGSTKRPGEDYVLDGQNIRFIVAPPVGVKNILVRYAVAMPTGITSANALTYTPPQDGIPTSVRLFLDRLWQTGLNKGAALIKWIQSGTGAVAQTIEQELRRVVRPEHFGAVGDGVADDSAAMQRAIDYLVTLPRGGELRLTAGKTYAFGARVNVPKYERLLITGYGAAITFHGAYTGQLLYIGEPVGITANPGIRIRGITFTGPYLPASPLGAYIFAQNANKALIEDCIFHAGSVGILLDNSFAVRVRNCEFSYIRSYGISAQTSCNNLIVSQCVFNSVSDSGGTGSDIYLAAYTHNIVIRDNDAEAGRRFFDLVAGGSSILIEGNYIEWKTSVAVFFGAATTGVRFVGNWLGYSVDQQWINIDGGYHDANTFGDQPQSQNVNLKNFNIGPGNLFLGTSNKIFSQWQVPTFKNSYTNTGGSWETAGFTKDANGIVRLRGMVQAPASNVAMTLPVDYRPTAQKIFNTRAANASQARINVFPNGDISCENGTDTTLDLGAVQFVAGN